MIIRISSIAHQAIGTILCIEKTEIYCQIWNDLDKMWTVGVLPGKEIYVIVDVFMKIVDNQPVDGTKKRSDHVTLYSSSRRYFHIVWFGLLPLASQRARNALNLEMTKGRIL